MYSTKNPILPNGQIFRPKHFANCKTIGVIYMLWCECSCFYIGKTKLEFWKRVYRHISSMETNNPDLPLGRHTRTVHGADFLESDFWSWIVFTPAPEGVTGTKPSSSWSWGGYISLKPLYLPASKRLYALSPFWRGLHPAARRDRKLPHHATWDGAIPSFLWRQILFSKWWMSIHLGFPSSVLQGQYSLTSIWCYCLVQGYLITNK